MKSRARTVPVAARRGVARRRVAAPAFAQRRASPAFAHLVPILVVSLAFGAYFVLRYLAFWSEQDTAVFTRIIFDMRSFGSISSPGVYTHGYAYPIWASTLSNLTGLSVSDLLQLYTPLVGNLFLGVFGFATFRRFLASDRRGLLAAIFLFLIPELVFTVSRGNHEKLTVSLTLFAALAFLASYLEMRDANRWRVFVAWVAVLYLTNFTLISLNVFLGSCFTIATTLIAVFALLIRAVKVREGRLLDAVIGRLVIVVMINWLLVLLVTSYVYPTSSTSLRLVDVIYERVSELYAPLLAPGPEAAAAQTFAVSDPYSVAETDWMSVRVFRVISSFRWVLLFGSAAMALVSLVGVLWRLRDTKLQRLFLLAFYGAYGVLVAVAIPIDFLNLSAGTNLQVRLYTYFAIAAAPMLALGVAALVERLDPTWLRLPALIVVGLLISGFAIISMLKSTLDPTISNRWLFYEPAEVQAMRFWDTEVWDVRDQAGSLWVGVQARLLYAYRTRYPEEPQRLDNFVIGQDLGTAHALASAPFRESVVRWRRVAPESWLEDRTYDNGPVQITHRTARTPFQR